MTDRAAVLRVCALAALPLVLAAPSRVDPPRFTDVYVAGENGYDTFRIPSVVVTRTGTALAFAEGRRNGPADAGDIDLVLKRSRDGGASWSAMQVVGDIGPNTFGNPCAVVDRKTGVVWLLSTQNAGADREK